MKDTQTRLRCLLWAVLHRYHPNGVEITSPMIEQWLTSGHTPTFRTTHNPQRDTYILSAQEK